MRRGRRGNPKSLTPRDLLEHKSSNWKERSAIFTKGEATKFFNEKAGIRERVKRNPIKVIFRKEDK